MAWITIAQGTSDNFGEAVPSVDHLDAGQKGRVVFYDIPAFGWKAFDVMGAEYVAQFLAPAGVQVTDVYGADSNGYIEFTVTGTPVIPIIAAVVAFMLAAGLLGILITIAMQIEELDPHYFTWQVIVGIAIIVISIAVVTVLVIRKGGKMGAGPVKVGN